MAVIDPQASAEPRAPGFSTGGMHDGRILPSVIGLIVLVVLLAIGRFALITFRESQSHEGRFEAVAAWPAVPAGTAARDLRHRGSFEGHPYVYAENPERLGRYAVVFTPSLDGTDERAYAAIRHVTLKVYGQDLSGVVPAVSRDGDALRVEFRADGITYVALAAWGAPLGRLSAFTLRREE